MSSEVPTDHLQLQYIRAALSDIMAPPKDKKVTKYAFTWNVDGTLETLKAYDGAELLFTLTFSWNADSTLKEVARS
jgi:hypothetical protein